MADLENDQTQTAPRGRVVAAASRETMIERRRLRRVTSLRPYAAVLFILVAFALVGKELERYWFHGLVISGAVIAISAVIGFLGAYMLNHADTKDAASFVVNNGIAIISAIRGGRRATDPVVVVTPPPRANVDDKPGGAA